MMILKKGDIFKRKYFFKLIKPFMVRLKDIWNLEPYFLRNVLLKYDDIYKLKAELSILFYNANLLDKYDQETVVDKLSPFESLYQEILIDNYLVLKILGTGLTGVVYKTISLDLKSIIVIKKVKTGNSVLQEIKVLEQIKKSIYCFNYIDSVIKNNNAYIMSEYHINHIEMVGFMAGNSLCKVRNYVKYLELFTNLSQGLRSIHKLGIAHRDVKLGNIIINPETFSIKYIDFGMSCLEDDYHLPINQRKRGTSVYMDTHLFKRDKNIELSFEEMKLSDMYSLGVVFYAILMGTTPFKHLFKIYKKTFEEIDEKAFLKIFVHKYSYNNIIDLPIDSVFDLRCDRLIQEYNLATSTELNLHNLLADNPYTRKFPY